MYPCKTHSICKEGQKIKYEKTWIIKYNQLKKRWKKEKKRMQR